MVAFNESVGTCTGHGNFSGDNETQDTVWPENDTYNFLQTRYEKGKSQDLKTSNAQSTATSKLSSWFSSWALPGSQKSYCKRLNAEASETSPDTINNSELPTRISRLEADARSYFTTLSPARHSKSSNNKSITWSRREDTARHTLYKSLGGKLADPSVSQSRNAPSCTSTPSNAATVETYVSYYPVTAESKAYLEDTVRLLRGRVRDLAATEAGRPDPEKGAARNTNTTYKPKGTLKPFDSTTIQVDRQTYDKSELSHSGGDLTSFSPSCSQVCGGLLATALTGAALYGVYKRYYRV